jgi:hypothetical protein
MSAAKALKAARAAGVNLGIDGDDLVLEAAAPPPPAVIDLLSRHKAEVVALLRPAEDGWSAEDWKVFFGERAGVAEFDGGLPRAEAETLALECCVVEWVNRNPETSPPGRCRGCGGRDFTQIPCCPMVSKAPAIHGCIRAVGPLGTKPVRPAPPPHCQRWGSRCQSTTIWARSTMGRFKRSAARPRSVSEVRRKKHEALKASLRRVR